MTQKWIAHEQVSVNIGHRPYSMVSTGKSEKGKNGDFPGQMGRRRGTGESIWDIKKMDRLQQPRTACIFRSWLNQEQEKSMPDRFLGLREGKPVA
jgi:hypothetical protein